VEPIRTEQKSEIPSAFLFLNYKTNSLKIVPIMQDSYSGGGYVVPLKGDIKDKFVWWLL